MLSRPFSWHFRQSALCGVLREPVPTRLAAQSATPLPPASWQAAQRFDVLLRLRIWACLSVSGPGANASLHQACESMTINAARLIAVQAKTKILRCERRLRRGTHGSGSEQ